MALANLAAWRMACISCVAMARAWLYARWRALASVASAAAHLHVQASRSWAVVIVSGLALRDGILLVSSSRRIGGGCAAK